MQQKNTTVLQSSRITKPLPTDQRSLQIVRVNNNHWVVASTLNCHKTVDTSIYDSLTLLLKAVYILV